MAKDSDMLGTDAPKIRMATRRSQRVVVDLPLRVWLDVGWRQARCADLSLTGLGVALFFPLPRGQRLTVAIDMGDGHSIETAAEVVREGVFPNGVAGLRFVDPSDATLAALISCMRRHSQTRLEALDFFADDN